MSSSCGGNTRQCLVHRPGDAPARGWHPYHPEPDDTTRDSTHITQANPRDPTIHGVNGCKVPAQDKHLLVPVIRQTVDTNTPTILRTKAGVSRRQLSCFCPRD